MPQLTHRQTQLPLRTRQAVLQPATFKPETRTVTVCFSAGAIGRRYDWQSGTYYDEEIVVTPEAVDMSRMEAGAVSVLDTHNRYSLSAIVGRAFRGWIERGEAYAEIQLSERDELAGIVRDIGSGVIRNISVGYSVQRYEVIRAADRKDGGAVDLWRAVLWTPTELSFVPVNFDMDAGTRSAEPTFPCEIVPFHLTHQRERNMPQTTTTEQPSHRDEIAALVRGNSHARSLPAAFTEALIERQGMTVEKAGIEILNELARRDEAAGGHLNDRSLADLRHEQRSAERNEGPRLLMVDALAARMEGRRAAAANPYRHATCIDLMRELLEERGVRTTGMSASQIVERGMHTTSDFPALLQGSGERVVRKAYEAFSGGIMKICREATARDFRARQRIKLSEFPKLLKVNEHGEFKHGTMSEAAESYRLETFGRIFGVTRQALVNDDLDAFGDLAVQAGRAGAELVHSSLAALLISNPTMAEDSTALFHANHGNLATGAGSALQESALTTARTAMRLRKGLDGTTPINAQPEFLIVPAALETTAEKLIAAIQPNSSSSVNPFAQRLQLVVDPRLDAASSTAWYLAASADLVDTIEYAYLEGANGPETFLREGFEVDGVQLKVRLDFGCGVQEWRGLYKANGA